MLLLFIAAEVVLFLSQSRETITNNFKYQLIRKNLPFNFEEFKIIYISLISANSADYFYIG